MPTLTPLSPSVSSTEFVPRSGVVAAGDDVFQNLLAAGDANPSFQVLGSGELQWGAGGASALDVSLKRNSANVLELADQFFVHRAAADNLVWQSRLDADGSARFDILADGKHEWGDGTSAVDTNLYRLTSAYLATDGSFRAIPATTATGAFDSRISSDTVSRFVLFADGKHEWGPGGGSGRDTNLYRFASNTLGTDDNLRVMNASGITVYDATSGALRAFFGAESFPRAQVIGGGGAAAYYLGPGSSAVVQVVGQRITGWAAATGTATRSTFATSSVTLPVLAEHVKALIDDLMTHGLIGT